MYNRWLFIPIGGIKFTSLVHLILDKDENRTK